jgi:hypothetical protein
MKCEVLRSSNVLCAMKMPKFYVAHKAYSGTKLISLPSFCYQELFVFC